jgi:polyhydroxybutyrate depolymerase
MSHKILTVVLVSFVLSGSLLAFGGYSAEAQEKGRVRQWLEKRRAAQTEQQIQDPTGESGTLSVQGQTRSYYLHLPATAESDKLPLVMAFHGGQGNGLKFSKQTGFNPVADRSGFAVVYPHSISYWKDGRATTASEVDHVAFVKALIDHLVETKNIDRQRVYATGASNGGMFTLRLACEMSDQIAAYAPVVASIPVPYKSKCKPVRPVTMMMINGTADQFIPWEGGTVRSGRSKGAGGEVIPVPDTVAFWQRHNGCSSASEVEALPDVDKDDGTTVEIFDYADCKDGAVVRLVKIDGGGHTWAGSPLQARRAQARIVGNTSREINGSEIIWKFFQGRALP